MAARLEMSSGQVKELRSGFWAHCRVCRAMPSRWRVANALGWDYFCERHEANKDMCAAASDDDAEEERVEVAHATNHGE